MIRKFQTQLFLIFSVVLIFLIDRDADVFAQRVTLFDIPSIANTPLSLFSNQTSNITMLCCLIQFSFHSLTLLVKDDCYRLTDSVLFIIKKIIG